MVQEKLESFMERNKCAISASIASVCSVIVGSPFDSIKVRMQTSNYKSSLDCTKQVYRTEGIRGFFRGILPPLFSVNLVKTILKGLVSVSSYEYLRAAFIARDEKSIFKAFFISGCIAGISTSFISAPLEMIRNQRFIHDQRFKNISAVNSVKSRALLPGGTSSFGYFKVLLQQHGLVKGVYRGFSLHLLREMFGTGVYWLTYETLHSLVNRHYSSSSASTSSSSSIQEARSQSTVLVHFLCGGVTGMVSWLFVFPIDLLKNVYQKNIFSEKSNGKSILQVAKEIGGVRNYYRGLIPTMLRAFPIHGLNLGVYEFLLGVFGRKSRVTTTSDTEMEAII